MNHLNTSKAYGFHNIIVLLFHYHGHLFSCSVIIYGSSPKFNIFFFFFLITHQIKFFKICFQHRIRVYIYEVLIAYYYWLSLVNCPLIDGSIFAASPTVKIITRCRISFTEHVSADKCYRYAYLQNILRHQLLPFSSSKR
jgi:hypothetical protein